MGKFKKKLMRFFAVLAITAAVSLTKGGKQLATKGGDSKDGETEDKPAKGGKGPKGDSEDGDKPSKKGGKKGGKGPKSDDDDEEKPQKGGKKGGKPAEKEAFQR